MRFFGCRFRRVETRNRKTSKIDHRVDERNFDETNGQIKKFDDQITENEITRMEAVEKLSFSPKSESVARLEKIRVQFDDFVFFFRREKLSFVATRRRVDSMRRLDQKSNVVSTCRQKNFPHDFWRINDQRQNTENPRLKKEKSTKIIPNLSLNFERTTRSPFL